MRVCGHVPHQPDSICADERNARLLLPKLTTGPSLVRLRGAAKSGALNSSRCLLVSHGSIVPKRKGGLAAGRQPSRRTL